ncbi:MAG: bifunctional phosphoribosylaminoimidazolecarboxamide formyltransferase/IMP cyclohydrolase [Candidatus Omnitrophota bacterium]
MITIKRAILSVSDKTGILDLAKALVESGAEIISTGGTAKTLREAKIPVTEVSDVTAFPEMLDGRVKTLHPKIFAGILFRREVPEHRKEVEKEGVKPVDLVCVNLYPFEKVVAKKETSLETAIENIDIGGPSLLRAAAKNSSDVVVLSDPNQYPAIINELKTKKGRVSKEIARQLGAAVFAKTSMYDAVISLYLNQEKETPAFPARISLLLEKIADLRYGENPHQKAGLYREKSFRSEIGLLVDAEQLQGKELSYNNYLDLEAALSLVRELDPEAAVIVKHNNPCGVALGPDILTAFQKARACDPVSAFGGIVALNRPVAEDTAVEIITGFVECVIAPEYSEAALSAFKKKPDIRVLRLSWPKKEGGKFDFRKVGGGFLVQDVDATLFSELKIVSAKSPDAAQLEEMKFAYLVAKYTKSNAIILVKGGQTIGIGAGQMSRVDSARIAVSKAKDFGFDIAGAAVASDAFFPFSDALEIVAKEGAVSVIHPGGSKKDSDVLATAEKYGMIMVMAGQRHFRH